MHVSFVLELFYQHRHIAFEGGQLGAGHDHFKSAVALGYYSWIFHVVRSDEFLDLRGLAWTTITAMRLSVVYAPQMTSRLYATAQPDIQILPRSASLRLSIQVSHSKIIRHV